MSDGGNNKSTFETMYETLKTVYAQNGLRPPEDIRERYDTSITFNLMKTFTDNAQYPMDRLNLGTGMVRITDEIRGNNTQWNPNHSDGVITDFITKHNPWKDEPIKTPEQQKSDENATAYLNGSRTSINVLTDVIAATPAVQKITINDAVSLAEADMLQKGDAGDILKKFPEANPSLVRAVAYTMLHIAQTQKHGQNTLSEELSDQARSHMHYATEESTEYAEWHTQKRDQVIKDIANDTLLISQLNKIKCPLNISTDEDLLEQRSLRDSIADNIVEKMAARFNVDNILGAEDATVAHLSRLNMKQQQEGIGSMQSHQVGILNDETIIAGYNPAYHLAEQDAFFMKTDMDEVAFFVDTIIEEADHAISNIYADKFVLGTLPDDAPLKQHAAMIALNDLVYTYGEGYANQYIEKTAKDAANDISFEVKYMLQNPEALTALTTPTIIGETNEIQFAQKPL